MIGAALFGGFLAGIAVTLAVFSLLKKQILQRSEPLGRSGEEFYLPENKELARLRQQLAEIDRYNGSEMGGF